jgi:hypothetical protein
VRIIHFSLSGSRLMSQVWLIVLVVIAATGIWFGFAEDLKIGVVGSLAALVAATFYAFHGGFGALEALPDYVAPDPKVTRQKQGLPGEDMATMRLVTLITVGVVVGFGGIWLAFAEDIKPAMLVSVLAVAGATQAAFRGKAAF